LVVALSDPETTGIWGATDQLQRASLVQQSTREVSAEDYAEGISILSDTLVNLAFRYGVDVRTIARWKCQLRSQSLFASQVELAA
jgi:hypothetical protein